MQGSLEVGLAGEGQMSEVCNIMREGYPPELLRGTIYESERFDSYLAERHRTGDLFLLAKDSGHAGSILGFAQVLKMESALHLNHLVVRPRARSLGVGAILLQNVILRAKKENCPVTLDVDSRNTGAIRFYEKADFKIMAQTPVILIPQGAGVMPKNLLTGSRQYEKYGFCYIDRRINRGEVKVGIVGARTVRLLAQDVPGDFDWHEFVAWAQWANIFVFGEVELNPDIKIQAKWSIFRMKN